MAREHKFPLFQHTCEGAALTLGLVNSRAVIWDRFSKAEKDQVVAVLLDYTHNRTNSHNWRWFNVMMGSFLKLEGYKVDDTLIRGHLDNILAAYAGDGWYRDMYTFDFYSPWAFQFYGPLWCRMYRFQHEPAIADIIQSRHREMMKTYPLMFSRKGHSLMWGRSIIYRCAASAPIGVHFLLKEPSLDPGWARRIASGNLMQFAGNKDCFENGIPAIGFYRTFDSLVQGYSCAISPFWLGKIFLALSVPPSSPFWTTAENEGMWAEIGRAPVSATLNGPGLVFTADPKTGAAELRSGKVQTKKADPNYTKLVYNTEFLWETDTTKGPNLQAYTLGELGTENSQPNMNLRFVGERNGVLYPQAELPGWLSKADLADILLPGGVLRVDRIRVPYKHELTLGHFALPHIGGKPAEVKTLDVGSFKGISAAIRGRRVVLVALNGWAEVASLVRSNMNPEAAGDSTLIFARNTRDRDYSGMYLCVTVMLYRTDNGRWQESELNPVKTIEYLPFAPSGSPLGARIVLRNGGKFIVDFGAMEGTAVQ